MIDSQAAERAIHGLVARGDLAAAKRECELLLQQAPRAGNAFRMLAVIESRLGYPDRAVIAIQEALKLDPDDPASLNIQGEILMGMNRLPAALAAFDRAWSRAPEFLPALLNRGNALLYLNRPAEALNSFERVIAADSLNAEATLNRGRALSSLGRRPEALESFTRAIALAPGHIDALIARADLLCRSGRLAEGLQDLDRVLALDPDHPMALQNSATALHMCGELEPAVARYERLIALLNTHLHSRPNAAEGLDYALGMVVSCRRTMCAWERLAAQETRLVERVLSGPTAFKPFLSLMITDDARVHALCARRTWSNQVNENVLPIPAQAPPRPRSDRLRIAYLCGDFRDHPTSWLIARLIEVHDRSRFEVYAFATIPADESVMGRRLANAFDAIVDISNLGDAEAAQTIAEHRVDILVDLSGFLDLNRGGVLARRPAPLSVHFLGYPGPLGAPWIDYFVADGIVLPREQDALYDCAVVRLPHSYQVNDDSRQATPHRPSHEAAGLPRESFVFCGFCQPVKLSAAVFDVWMRILAKVPDSVLWLLEDNRYVSENLREEARRRGIDPIRLVFAARVDQAEHMARLPLAQLMLDTWPCGAHTTGSDALWAGVPFITRLGSSFASRVGTSLVRALGMPELAVETLAEYESLAVELAQSTTRLADIRRRLDENKRTAPLFNTSLFRGHIEAAYDKMWERFASGRAPESFDVPIR
jgi:predicted O-linked N-acetylglucosamine transferase (SPINDLY family)